MQLLEVYSIFTRVHANLGADTEVQQLKDPGCTFVRCTVYPLEYNTNQGLLVLSSGYAVHLTIVG